jgi:hypothetical protein
MKDKVRALSPEDLKVRTKALALREIRLSDPLPKRADAQVLGRQLLSVDEPCAARPCVNSGESAERPAFQDFARHAGLPEDTQRGWRRALFLALSDGEKPPAHRKRRRPVESDLVDLPLFRQARP